MFALWAVFVVAFLSSVSKQELLQEMKAYMYVELECLQMCSCEAEMAAGDSQTGHTSFPFVSCHRCNPTLSCGKTPLL